VPQFSRRAADTMGSIGEEKEQYDQKQGNPTWVIDVALPMASIRPVKKRECNSEPRK
jgi:hypothetical protein